MTHDMLRVTAPGDLAAIVTLAEAKAHLRVTHLAEDDLISRHCEAVADYLDGYDGRLGRALRPQSWRLTLSCLPERGLIRLPLVPFTSITSIAYDDAEGEAQTLDPALYRARIDEGFGIVLPALGEIWPADMSDIRVTYLCGHDPALRPMPRPIFQAALLLIGDAYDNRAAQVEGKLVSANPAVERLLAPYQVRSWR